MFSRREQHQIGIVRIGAGRSEHRVGLAPMMGLMIEHMRDQQTVPRRDFPL